MAQSYLHNTSRTAGAAVEAAADKKTAKYAPLVQTYVFVPIAVETMGAINSDGLEFLGDQGRRITQVTDDIRESAVVPAPVSSYSALQCGRHPGHLYPLRTNSRPFQPICF